MSEQWYPGANTGRRYDAAYPGSRMDVNTVVWHSTEGTSLPGYGGGSYAPTLTAVPDFRSKKLKWYQHFPFNESARALENDPGGVQTNTLNVVQVEIVGTCDPATHRKWTQAGRTHLYMPELPDWAIRDLGAFAAWVRSEHDVPLTSDVDFNAYPDSYGANQGDRMTHGEWLDFRGHCGHQHVPENDHGDPGAFPMAEILAAARGEQPDPVPDTPADPPADRNAFPGAAKFGPGANNAYVTRLGEMLVKRGGRRFYREGPGPRWSDADRKATEAFQRAQGWTGADADGIPGPQTWGLLTSGKGKSIPAAGGTTSRPAVSLSRVIAASRRDPGAPQGSALHPEDVKPVEAALKKLGFLGAAYAADGSYGTKTRDAYNRFRRSIGLKGTDAAGDPGNQSLSILGSRSGLFTVKK